MDVKAWTAEALLNPLSMSFGQIVYFVSVSHPVSPDTLTESTGDAQLTC